MSVPVLYISYDGMTDPLGQSQVIPYLAGLSKLGYKFTLLSCEKKEVFEKNKDKISKLLASNNIEWKPLMYTKSPPVLSTVYDVLKIKKLAFQLHKERNFSIVHCRSYIAAMVGLQMKKEFGIKFIFDMRGLWADERVDGKLWNLRNPVYNSVYNYFKKKETEFLRSSDYTISLTHNAKDEILSWNKIGKEIKIEVIPCCVDLDLFNSSKLESSKIDSLKKELKISEDDFLLLYLGSIGTWYMLDEMMEFFSLLKKEKPNAKFFFVTKDEHARILNTAEKYNVSGSIILRPGAREEIPYLISICNFSIFFILPSYSKKASSPTKQGEIMAMGVPLLCNTKVGDTDKIVMNYESGILIDGFSKEAYFAAISKLSSPFNINKIKEGANDYFSLEKGVSKYAAIYKAVLA